MDIKDLVQSSLFYPEIWQNESSFSQVEGPIILPYNGEIDDLEFEDPTKLFEDFLQGSNPVKLFKNQDIYKKLQQNLQKQIQKYDVQTLQEILHQQKLEEFEMQYNIINVGNIEGDDKVSVSRTLKDCKDLELFEQESIQMLIDFKWNTYTKHFFMAKFFLYFAFVGFYYVDIESGLQHMRLHKSRISHLSFFLTKGITMFVMFLFLLYEIQQFKIEKAMYIRDVWNYMEVLGITVFYLGAYIDIERQYENPTSLSNSNDFLRVIWTLSLLLTLVKILIVIQVFPQLNFLVIMFSTVTQELGNFMFLFAIFCMIFAECFNVCDVDVSGYGRTPPLMSHVINTLRGSFGDQGLLDVFQTLDLKVPGSVHYRTSEGLMLYTWFIWFLSIFFLTMVFMNFIIAVIGETYTRVSEFKVAHNYQQKASMIYELEMHFGDKQFENILYFPRILIVRKKKTQQTLEKSDTQKNWPELLKTFLKQSQEFVVDKLQSKLREQKQHMTNSIKTIENDVSNLNKELEKTSNELHAMMMRIYKQTVAVNQRVGNGNMP